MVFGQISWILRTEIGGPDKYLGYWGQKSADRTNIPINIPLNILLKDQMATLNQKYMYKSNCLPFISPSQLTSPLYNVLEIKKQWFAQFVEYYLHLGLICQDIKYIILMSNYIRCQFNLGYSGTRIYHSAMTDEWPLRGTYIVW